MPALALSLAALVSACTAGSPPRAAPPAASPGPGRPVHLSAAQIARLPAANTFGSAPLAPLDPDPLGVEHGVVLHPSAPMVVYARPGGRAVAVLPTTQLGSPTWVPVVQSAHGWDRVLLPTRPNHSTGWIYLAAGGWRAAYSAYQVEVHLADYRLTVSDGGHLIGSWPVAVGTAGTPTPLGRTFLLASVAPVHPTYSPLILPLGVHSNTMTAFGGGPGTVGLHGWPDPAVFGHAVSHGCVRVPAAALQVLSRVPLGSSVLITG